MADAEGFKTFDKAPIIGKVMSRWSIGIREVILAIIAALLLVLVIIFAGLFGGAKQELSASIDGSKASAIVSTRFCTDPGCLKTAAHVTELMNQSVDPCDNFYEYACGNYDNIKPVYGGSDYVSYRNILADMREDNDNRLINVLEQPPSDRDYGYERKLKDFFTSCNDMYSREKLKGKPFLTQVVQDLGGWKLLGNWQDGWDFKTALKKVHAHYLAPAFFYALVDTDWETTNARVINLLPHGDGNLMYWYMYTAPGMDKAQSDYKKFIRRVGELFVRDFDGPKLPNDTVQQYLDEFVEDAFNVEKNIAQIARYSGYSSEAYNVENRVTLQDFDRETENVFDWVGQMTYLYDNGGVTANTKIVVLRREYFVNITQYIKSLPVETRNRTLHNYLIWRVAENYVTDMSWDYIHANREVYVDLYKRQQFSGVYKYCFRLMTNYMADAISSLFVNEHFVQTSKDMVYDITTNLKIAFQGQIDKSPWFDEETKQKAKDKVDKVTFKMGHPDWMDNPQNVDRIYNRLTINSTDFFGNCLRANRLIRDEWNDQLAARDTREEWDVPTYYTNLWSNLARSEIVAPAGMLQFPMYEKNLPHSLIFGSLGTVLGRMMHHQVDEIGQLFDADGVYDYQTSWWSNASKEAYKPIQKCIQDVYSNITKEVRFLDGVVRPVTINATRYSRTGMAYTTGIRVAQIAYEDWRKSKGLAEKMLPGVGMTNEQMIYLGHAQVYCFVRDEEDLFMRALRGSLDSDTRVNMAMGQLQEFSDAFGCKAATKMNHPKKCQYH